MTVLRICASIAVFMLAIAQASAQSQTSTATTSATVGAWTLTTDQLALNLRTGTFSAPGPLTMKRADGSIVTADRATGNYKKKTATLYGHVSLYDVSGTFGLAGPSHEKGPAKLTADQLQLDDTRRVYDAQGSVHYEQADAAADAQRAHLDDRSHRLDLAGPVHAVQGQRTLDAQRATYNTSTGEGEADGNATLVFPAPTPAIATPKPIKIPLGIP